MAPRRSCCRRGMDLRLEVDPSTLAALRERGVTLHVLGTRDAVELYNKRCQVTLTEPTCVRLP